MRLFFDFWRFSEQVEVYPTSKGLHGPPLETFAVSFCWSWLLLQQGILRLRSRPIQAGRDRMTQTAPLCGASVTRRSDQIRHQRKGSPEGPTAPLVGCRGKAPTLRINKNRCGNPQRFIWSGRRGSDSRPPPWQGGALPTELLPHMVRTKRLELLRHETPDPKSGASAIPPRPHEQTGQRQMGNDPLEIRTPDTLIKSQVLCQLS